jgi:parallel beta-helix repeat protein
MKQTAWLIGIASLVMLGSFVPGVNGEAFGNSLSCGDTIFTDTTLENDLNCPPGVDGLTIGASDITLNLGGYTISGNSGHSGIVVWGHDNISVFNGSISGFQYGILGDTANDLNLENVFLENQSYTSILIFNSKDFIILESQVSLPPGGGDPDPQTGHVAEAIRLVDVKHAMFRDISVVGGYFGVLMIGEGSPSHNVSIEDSFFVDVGTGIRIINSKQVLIKSNTIIGAEAVSEYGCYSAIDVVEPSSSIRIEANDLSGCSFGIFAVPTTPPTRTLRIYHNELHHNGDGIYLMGVNGTKVIGNEAWDNEWVGITLVAGSSDNSILNNVALDNGYLDMFHDDTSTGNRWHHNTCEVSQGFEIDCP